ncbi:MAG: hypothetical protein ACON3Z_16500 [Bradymonadia bacterium]
MSESFKPAPLCHIVESNIAGWRAHRIRQALNGPLAVVTEGYLSPVADLWVRLHQRHGRPAWHLSSAEYCETRLPSDARTLLLCNEGRHHDMLCAFRHALSVGSSTHVVTHHGRSAIAALMREHLPDNEVFLLERLLGRRPIPDLMRLLPYIVLSCTVTGFPVPYAECFSVRPPIEPPLQRYEHFVIFAKGLARPAAMDFACRINERRLAPASVHDLRSFAHGAAAAYDAATTCFVFFCMPSHIRYAESYRAKLPNGTATTLVPTTRSGVHGAISLLARAARLAESMSEFPRATAQVGTDWVRNLYLLAVDNDQ